MSGDFIFQKIGRITKAGEIEDAYIPMVNGSAITGGFTEAERTEFHEIFVRRAYYDYVCDGLERAKAKLNEADQLISVIKEESDEVKMRLVMKLPALQQHLK